METLGLDAPSFSPPPTLTLGAQRHHRKFLTLAIVIMYLFLENWRHALLMLLTLPITLIIYFALMQLMGFSLNIFSLGGLVVAIGVVLDISIVVLENITRLRHLHPD